MAIPNVLLQLAKNNPKIQQIKQMYQMVQSSQNPTAMLNQLIQNNPQIKQVMDFVNQSGGDTNNVIRTVAEQNGLKPEDIYDLLK